MLQVILLMHPDYSYICPLAAFAPFSAVSDGWADDFDVGDVQSFQFLRDCGGKLGDEEGELGRPHRAIRRE